MMANYNLKVDACSPTHRLSGLAPVSGGKLRFKAIDLVERKPGDPKGYVSPNAATIFLEREAIQRIHDRVNDRNPSRDVQVHFNVSSMNNVSNFSDSYTS
jgi:hypothetical protein